jgi:hypothetical protein
MEKNQTLKELILEAVEEARILECARESYDEDNVMLTAMRLSGAPFSFIKEVINGP